jgi:hypothetical protein
MPRPLPGRMMTDVTTIILTEANRTGATGGRVEDRLPLVNDPTAGQVVASWEVDDVVHASWMSQEIQETFLRLPFEDLLHELHRHHRPSARLFVEEDGYPAGVDDDEGILAVVVGRQDLHGVGKDGFEVLLGEGVGDRFGDLDVEFLSAWHRCTCSPVVSASIVWPVVVWSEEMIGAAHSTMSL